MEQLIQHFRKDEQPFIEKAVGWLNEVENRYAPKLTDFLDPRERFIVSSIAGQNGDFSVVEEGIFPSAERKRLYICPSYFIPTKEEFNITVYTVSFPSKFVQIGHRDVLGATLSLGVDRMKFGDIRVNDSTVQFAIASEIADYVETNLTSIGKVKVRLEEVQVNDKLIQLEESWAEKSYTVSSMRLDAILANVLNISRQKSQMLINAGKVKVNWTVRETTSFELQEGDVVSARGYGRIKILMIEGRTRKEKIRLQVGRLEQK